LIARFHTLRVKVLAGQAVKEGMSVPASHGARFCVTEAVQD